MKDTKDLTTDMAPSARSHTSECEDFQHRYEKDHCICRERAAQAAPSSPSDLSARETEDNPELTRAAPPRPLTYLASPYSHPDRAVRVARFEAANAAAGKLMMDGHKVFSPISHTHPIAECCGLPLGWDFWEAFDRAYLSHCRLVVVLRSEGWQDSKGVAGELRIAAELGIPVEYMDPSREWERAPSGAPSEAVKSPEILNR